MLSAENTVLSWSGGDRRLVAMIFVFLFPFNGTKPPNVKRGWENESEKTKGE